MSSRSRRLNSAVEGSLDHIGGIPGTKRLGQNVFEACQFENGPHCLARDDPCARRSWPQQHFRAAIVHKHFVRNSRILQRHTDHLRAGHFAALANCIRHFAGLAQTNSHSTVLVANNDQCAEVKTASAFDDFGGTIDEDDLLGELLPGLLVESGRRLRPSAPPAAWSASRAVFAALCFGWFRHSIRFHYALELQTRFARCVGQGFHLAMVTRAAAVKNHPFDSLAQGGLCR